MPRSRNDRRPYLQNLAWAPAPARRTGTQSISASCRFGFDLQYDSFPSGHALTIVCVAVILSGVLPASGAIVVRHCAVSRHDARAAKRALPERRFFRHRVWPSHNARGGVLFLPRSFSALVLNVALLADPHAWESLATLTAARNRAGRGQHLVPVHCLQSIAESAPACARGGSDSLMRWSCASAC